MRLVDADRLLTDRMKSKYYHLPNGDIAIPLIDIEHAPTIEPERKPGKWIYGESEIGNDGYYCSVCGNFVPWKYGEYDIDFIQEFLFCNKCGAKMEGEEPEDIPMEYFESGGR